MEERNKQKKNVRGILEEEHKKENNFLISFSCHMTNGKNIYTNNGNIREPNECWQKAN